MTVIVDYRAGNLTSVKLAFAALGEPVEVTNDPAKVRAASRVVFPGVGAARSAMENLRDLGLVDAVKEAAMDGRPFLGICLGMQILFARSEEDGGVDTIGVLPGQVRKFPAVPGCKVPEIGWNQVNATNWESRHPGGANWESRHLGGANWESRHLGGAEYYFVHSYYAELGPWTFGKTEYAGIEFTSMVKQGRMWACQFHPEKSGRVGLELLKGWLAC